MNNFQNNFYRKKIFVFFLFLFFSFFSFVSSAQAFGDFIGGPTAVIRKITDFIEKNKDKAIIKAGSLAFQSTLQSALKVIAYDLANYIATGGEGQKALWSKEYITEFSQNAGNAAIGKFVEDLNKSWQVDLCHPSLDFKVGIGFGIVAYNQPEFYEPKCDWQEMKSGWQSEYDRWASMTKPDFVNKVSSMFSMEGNDLTIGLELFSRSVEVGQDEKEKQEAELKKNNGWLDVRNIGGKSTSPPGDAKSQLDQTRTAQTNSLSQFTGDALVDATNIFLNQLFISSFNNFLSKIGETIPDEKKYSFSNPYADPNSDPNISSGGSYVVETLKKVIQPRFNVKADYNILSDLMICLDINNPGPTNCVIENKFSQAIQNKNTVIEAVNNSYLSSDWIFNKDIDYNSGFNYRSLVILRKFRIIPLGWEEAFNRIQEKTAQTGFNYTLMDMISCFDPNDEYIDFSYGFLNSNFSNSSWCEGLIDPNWVLKAPLNYCKKQGYGGYIDSKQVVNLSEEIYSQENVSPIIISRSDNYCADEQSCIKEKADGSCELYGYCTEEKRVWNFGSDSCDPIYNTCDSFTSASSGKKLALLQNTIDYSSCNSDNVGCSKYANTGSYSAIDSKLTWNNYSHFYFNKQVESCSANNEGCQEFIRTVSGSGHNFLINGDFEDILSIGDWSGLSTSSSAYNSNISILVNSPLNKNVIVAPSGYSIAGESYNLSFYSWCTGPATSTISLGSKSQAVVNSNGFEYQSINYTYPNNYSSNVVSFTFTPNGNDCFIDNIKLEKGKIGTFYSNYRGNGLTYERVIPEYLKTTCYVSPFSTVPDYRVKTTAPSECFKYARLCNYNEVGCELFTSIYNIKIPAKVLDKDYCPDQCVGYDIYVQNKTLFEEKKVEKFIPGSARSCGLSDVGCTEFTNLDEISAGGEKKEYYSHLKHCIKPNQGDCDNFYTWEGNDESGYQLRSFSLERENDSIRKPRLTEGLFILDPLNPNRYIHQINNTIVCSKDIYNLPVSDPNYNSDCREFYNQQGNIIYVLYTKTITCSENCKTYRMTEKNINSSINSASACNNLNFGLDGKIIASWDGNNNVCYHCLAGGTWDSSQNACIYKAIPNEGKVCQATNNNCREYNGNYGNNIKIVSSFDFSQGNIDVWEGASTSTESINQGGYSLKVGNPNPASTIVGDSVTRGSSYVIKFLAKSAQNEKLSIFLNNNVGDLNGFGLAGADLTNFEYSLDIPASNDWNLYQVNLEKLDHPISADEKLTFDIYGSNPGVIFISNIVLIEITNRYYLIKNSWETPNICYYDVFNNYQGVNYNLGCQNYTDRSNKKYPIRQFSSLCDSSAVGCEMMVKTNNYNSPYSSIFNDTNNNGVCDSNEGDCISVPADSFVSVVNDNSKSCSSANKGCSRFGKLMLSNIAIATQNIYNDVYLKNDPNKYSSILCRENEVGCDAWSSGSGSGTSYFKDPGDNLCQWRKGPDTNSGFAWYKKAVKKCKINNGGFTSSICLTNNDCGSNQTCELDNGNYLCPVDNLKTIGLGGSSPVYQPSEQFGVKWAGLCPIKEAGCTEYIDPVSSFNSNLVLNPNFSDLDGDGQYFDLWDNVNNTNCIIVSSSIINCSASTVITYKQKVQNLISNKLYILKTNGNQRAILTCSNPIYELIGGSISSVSSNNFSSATNTLEVNINNPQKIFYSANNVSNSCEVQYIKSAVVGNIQIGFLDENKKEIKNNKLSWFNKIFNIKSTEAQSDDISIEIKEMAIDYQLKQNLDFTSCGGKANFNNGCVLFNERAYLGNSGLAPLIYNASNYSNYSTCSGVSCSANKLIKVKPDRSCGKWLSCYAYSIDPNTGDKVCLEMGECTSFNYDGTCFNFSKAPDGVREYTPGRDNNATGYSILGMDYPANMKQVGQDSNFLYEFDKADDLVSFADTNYSTISTTSCFINRPNHGSISGKKVSYPALGIGFLMIGGNGNDCGSNNNNKKTIVSNMMTGLLANNDYYLSFIINNEDLAFNEKAEILVFGVDSGNNLIAGSGAGAPYLFEIEKGTGWREISKKFIIHQSWVNGFRIFLRSPGSNPFFIDDIKIEPALEVVKSATNGKFIPATCRLYPTQDSLLCESENKNFITNGWYGYCLQKDPKNPEVCLMWYPIDAIKGGKGASFSSTVFLGYPSTGGKSPYYCAEMSANFDLVERREAYKRAIFKTRSSSSLPDIPFSIQNTIGACPSGYDYAIIRMSDGDAGDCSNVLGVCGGGTWYTIRMDYCLPNNFGRILENPNHTFNYTNYTSYPYGRNLRPSCGVNGCQCCSSNFECNAGQDYYYGQLVNGTTYKYADCVHPDSINNGNQCGQLSCNNFVVTSSGEGWYKYDGNLSTLGGEVIKLLSYDYTTLDDCNYFEGQLVDVSGSAQKACLMEVDKFIPKCTKFVRGDIPWVDRLNNSTLSIRDYVNVNTSTLLLPSSPFNNYKLGLTGSPFGAIINNGSQITETSLVFAGSKPTSANYFGFPYSCNSYGKTVNINNSFVNSCASLFFNNSVQTPKISARYGSNINLEESYLYSTGDSYKDKLKHIWLKTSPVTSDSDYSYIANSNFPISFTTNSNRVPEEKYEAVLPDIVTNNGEKIRLFSSIGLEINSDNNQKFTVTSPGFYTISFNTRVDKEQTPISKITIRIKENAQTWTKGVGQNIIINKVDPMSDPQNPHRLIKYLPQGVYQILVKVEDNWGFYRCAGLGGFDGNNSDCDNCCKNSLYDLTSFEQFSNPFCEECPSQY